MQKSMFRALVALLLIIICRTAALADGQARQGVVRVKLQPEVAATVSRVAPQGKLARARRGQVLSVGVEHLDASLRRIKGATIRRVFPCSAEREAAHAEFGLDRWYEITFDEGVNAAEARHILGSTPGVESASTKVPMTLYDNPTAYRTAPAPRASAADMPFNDPRLPQQWHYRNDGSMQGSVAGADINLFEAWKLATGSSKVVVAIIDGGIDYRHEDLADNMWVNAAEMNGTPGVDDDGNGYVDDIYGFNFCMGDGTIYPHNHGTHVAGTVAAVNNNGVGVAGVAGGDGTPGSGVRLMSCQTFDPRSGAPDGDFAAAIIYAADNGATIAQCSWGWSDPGYYEQDVLDAIRYFTSTARSNNMTGGLCIFAAGNERENDIYFPQSMPEVLSVAAMTYDLLPANYSNYASWVDVTAPGGLMDFDSAQGILSTLPENTYGYNEGTSMAAPHVSGIAALVLSKYGSSTMINENLRQQLVTSVNDFYTHNPLAEGLFGEGYIDAYKALQWGNGTAPQAVSDLAATASQDVILLTWTIPASSDNNVNNHVIFYSTEPFDANHLDGCRTISVDTKFLSSGDAMTYEIGGLMPMTTYYLAVRASDRWNNVSPLSEVITATTNEGPQMTLNKSTLTLSTTDGSTWKTSDFTISNTGAGILKWSASARTTSSAIRNYAASTNGLVTSARIAHADGIPAPKAMQPDETVEAFTRDEYPRIIDYYTVLHAFIGDDATTNSLAQLFTVDADEYPDGFNLTHLVFEGTNGLNPTIEVYRNTGTLNQSTCLLSFKPSFNYYAEIALTEQLYFAPGESFYVVAHFTEYENRNYPLGMGLSDGSLSATRSYFSTDLGASWSLLADALKGSAYEEFAPRATWAVQAISRNPDWSRILSLDPDSGQILGGESTTVTVGTNGTLVPNGTYRARLYFDTNETHPDYRPINVSINVSGQQPQVSYDKVVQFGNVIVGQSKTLNIEVANTGYGSFSGSSASAGIFSNRIKSTSEHFHGPEYLQMGIPSRSKVVIPVTYTPTESGSHSGVIVISDYQGHELRINVQGAATDPAHMVVDPEGAIEVGELDADGTTKEVSFTITNDGRFPLEMVMPKFTDTMYDDILDGSTHRFGYSYEANLYDAPTPEYTGIPQLLSAKNIASQFTDYSYFSEPVELPFDFPFYGKTYSKLYITSFGMLTFDTYDVGLIYSPLNEHRTDYLTGLGVISAYGFQCYTSPSSRIEYGIADGKFVVNYIDVLGPVYSGETRPISFHIALSPNGDIDIAYHKYDPSAMFQKGNTLWIGVVDPDMDDPLTLTSSTMTNYFSDDDSEPANRYKHVATGTAVHFAAPRPDMIRSVSPSAAIVTPGETITVNAVVGATDEMYAGDTYTNLVIRTNDISRPTAVVRFNATIVGDLHPEFALAGESIDFGNVMRTSDARMPLTVLNRGRAPMTVDRVSVASGRFTHDFTEPFEVLPGQSKDIVVALPTQAEGEVADVLTVETSAGAADVALRGTVIGVPVATLGYDNITARIASGTSAAYPLTITNDGNEPLTYDISVGSHISYMPEIADDSAVSYAYAASIDYPDQKREWIDIETNGLGHQTNFSYYASHDFVAVDLPFDFPFYGKTYSKIYIYNAGFVTFDYRHDDAIWPEPPADFPQGSVFTNLIAPYWGLHTMDVTKTAGTFYYVTDEQAVISFIEYGNSMNIGVDFQLVLRKDGTFTFNYKAAFDYADIFAPFGVAGICGPAAEDGILLPDRNIAFGNTVNFHPVVVNTLAPGESATADITVLADDLAGHFTSAITVNTNVPTTPVITVPVELTITGYAIPTVTADVTVEHVAEHVDFNFDDLLIGGYGVYWYEPVEVSNRGTARFTITSVDMTCPKYNSGFGPTDQFTLMWYGSVYDDFDNTYVTGWHFYDGSPIEVGRTPVKFAVPMWGNDNSVHAWDTPGEYDIALTFNFSGSGLKKATTNIKYIVTDKPAMSLDRDEIAVVGAPKTGTVDEKIVISNVEGLHGLEWTVRIDPTGVGEEVPQGPTGGGGGINPLGNAFGNAASSAPAPAPAPAPSSSSENVPTALVDGILAANGLTTKDMHADKTDDIYVCPQNFEYNRALYYPTIEGGNVPIYNYGTNTTYMEYTAATGFTAPKDGFNISHIYFGVLPYGLDNKDVIVRVLNGDPQRGVDVLGQGLFTLEEYDDPMQSRVYVAALDKPVYVAEGQDFYIAVTYPAGQKYPALLSLKEDKYESNRYMGHVDNYGWFDVAALFQDSYGSLGYLLSAIETVEGDSWIKVLTPDGKISNESAGFIAAGQSGELTVRFAAANAPKEKGNKAMLVFKSNDPAARIVNVPVTLDMNSTPEIVASQSAIVVNEGSTTTFSVSVTDVDADDFTVTLADNGSMSCLQSATPGEGCSATVTDDGKAVAVSGGNVTLVIAVTAPDGLTGDYGITFTATDTEGNVGSHTVAYTVAHVNHAPIALEQPTISVAQSQASPVIDLAAMFTDPDGDELDYTFTLDADDIVDTFVSANSVILVGRNLGVAHATATATDPAGASASTSFDIVVVNQSGIEALDPSVMVDVRVDKVAATINLTLGLSGDVAVDIYSVDGRQVLTDRYEALEGRTRRLDASALAPGIYVLTISTPRGALSQPIVL